MLSNAHILFPAGLALLGLLIGSFLNVCIYRIIRDLSVVHPRSFCPECGQFIAWYDNIPVISFVWLRGRCRACQAGISLRYPLVELMMSLLFALLAARYGLSLACLKWCLFESLLTILFFTDLEERILPDEITLGGAAAGLLLALIAPLHGVLSDLFLSHARPILQSLFEAVMGSVILTLPIWALAIFWGRFRKREMLGLGDVKLLPMIGAFLGLEHSMTALLVGSISGVIIGGGYIFAAGKKAASYELPLGSFFCLGAGLIPLFTRV